MKLKFIMVAPIPLMGLGLFTIIFRDKVFDPRVFLYSYAILLIFVGFYILFIRRGLNYDRETEALDRLSSTERESLINYLNQTSAAASQKARVAGASYEAFIARVRTAFTAHKQLVLIPECLYKLVQQIAHRELAEGEEAIFDAVERDRYEFKRLCTIFRDVALSIGIIGTFLGFITALQGTKADDFSSRVVPGLTEAIGSSLVAVVASVTCTVTEWLMNATQHQFRLRFQLFLWDGLLPQLSARSLADTATQKFVEFLDQQNQKMGQLIGEWHNTCSAIGKTMTNVEQVLPGTLTKLSETTAQMQENLDGFTKASSGISDTATVLKTTLLDVGREIHALSSSIKSQTEDLRGIAETIGHNRETFAKLGPQVENLIGAAEKLELSSSTLTRSSQAVGQCLDMIQTEMPNWTDPVKSMERVSLKLDASVGQMGSYVQNIDAHTQQVDDAFIQNLTMLTTQVENVGEAIQMFVKRTERQQLQTNQQLDTATQSVTRAAKAVEAYADAAKNYLSLSQRVLSWVRRVGILIWQLCGRVSHKIRAKIHF